MKIKDFLKENINLGIIKLEFDQKKLFFIISPPRSGTTLMQQLMNSFSGFCNTEESRIAGPNTPSCWQYVIRDNDFSYLEKFFEEKWTREFFVEKSPTSIFCLPKMLKKYPDANYIFLQRNPEKILQSILNLFFGISQIGRRSSDLGQLLKDEHAVLKFEEGRARQLLKMIFYQAKFKPLFQKQVTIKYEDLIDSLDSNLTLLENSFGIKSEQDKAHKCLKRPSGSSNFRYWYKDLYNTKARALTKLACRLWNYN